MDILYLGSVKIAGLTPIQADEKIGQIAIEKHALLPPGNGSAGPQVSVTVLQSRNRVFSALGLGTVSRPGTYNIIGSDFRVLDALALAGDIQVQPGLDYLYVIRSTAKQTTAGPAADETGTTGTPTPPPPTGNPLEAIESIEKNTTSPSTGPASGPSKAPATAPHGPGFDGPAVCASAADGGVKCHRGAGNAGAGGSGCGHGDRQHGIGEHDHSAGNGSRNDRSGR